jgi:hypothetical protein
MTVSETLRTPITLYIALDASQAAAGDVYVDDGESYKYEDGDFVHAAFTYADGTLAVSAAGNLSFPAPHVRALVIYGADGVPPVGLPNASVACSGGVCNVTGIDLALTGEAAAPTIPTPKPPSTTVYIVLGIFAGIIIIAAGGALSYMFRSKKHYGNHLEDDIIDEKDTM